MKKSSQTKNKYEFEIKLFIVKKYGKANKKYGKMKSIDRLSIFDNQK